METKDNKGTTGKMNVFGRGGGPGGMFVKIRLL